MDANTEQVLVTIAASGPITKQGLVKKTALDGTVIDAALKTLAKQKVIACVAGTRSWRVIEDNSTASGTPASGGKSSVALSHDAEPNLSPDGPLYHNPPPTPPEAFDEDTVDYIRLRTKLGDPAESIAARLEVPEAMVLAVLEKAA